MRVINDNIHEDFRLPNEVTCPCCKCKMNTGTSMDDYEPPRHNDYAICAGCGEILVYNVCNFKYSLRKADEEDLLEAKRLDLLATIMETQNYIRNTNHGLKVIR